MNLSFYSAAVGGSAHQSRLDTIANNMANLNTAGYKAQDASFVDLLYTNIYAPADAQNENLKTGCGTRYEKTDVLFEEGRFMPSEGEFDYALKGRGFFAVRDLLTQEVRYTRDGSFHMSQGNDEEFYLVTSTGERVLDVDGEEIVLTESGERIADEDMQEIGVYDFNNTEGMRLVGKNQFVPVPKNGPAELVENPDIVSGYLEMSNADLGDQIAQLIETQRVFQLSMRMITTSDEIEQTINNLR